jgi:hypothetical protein
LFYNDGADQPPLDPEVDECAVSGEGDDLAARTRPAGPAGVHVSVVDNAGVDVVHADITCWVTPGPVIAQTDNWAQKCEANTAETSISAQAGESPPCRSL